jgi:hypothetical protein
MLSLRRRRRRYGYCWKLYTSPPAIHVLQGPLQYIQHHNQYQHHLLPDPAGGGAVVS